jgi:hypothetical protein
VATAIWTIHPATQPSDRTVCETRVIARVISPSWPLMPKIDNTIAATMPPTNPAPAPIAILDRISHLSRKARANSFSVARADETTVRAG